ncbi:hypothetical protein MNBD_GAMMA18-1354 [hydrothermal vent metagenome]|uniref:Uncharacterized protein n=1 Tax=hydrothermal vent metagenome TaxID=652676 RepID=A0A3B0YTX3_9ZZZZ
MLSRKKRSNARLGRDGTDPLSIERQIMSKEEIECVATS